MLFRGSSLAEKGNFQDRYEPKERCRKLWQSNGTPQIWARKSRSDGLTRELGRGEFRGKCYM